MHASPVIRHRVTSWTHCPRCAVVFGEVTGGMDIVRSIEALGSGQGKTKKEVKITDCGQL